MPQVGYYLNLFTSEYQNATNLLTWAQYLLQPWVDLGIAAGTMYSNLDLDYAVGAQLDVLGAIVGASRTLPFNPTGGLSSVLGDSDYQIYLQAKIAQNQWDGQAGSLWAIWQQLFPGGSIYVEDNQNMTATIILAGNFSPIMQQMITNGLIVPRPEAVEYTYTFATLPIFGCDVDNSVIAGPDLGHCA